MLGVFYFQSLWVVDGLWPNVEFSVQLFDEFLYPFNLEVCWKGSFAVSYNADADSLAAVVPGSAWYDWPLSLPFFAWLYLAIVTAQAVANNKVAVDILGIGQATQRGQLFDVTGLGAAIVNFNAAPVARELGGSRENNFFDRTETVISRKRKCTSGWRIIAQSH